MAAKPKQKSGLTQLINKRITMTDLSGTELNPEKTLILRGFDTNYLELENLTSGKTGFFSVRVVSFITEHKEQG